MEEVQASSGEEKRVNEAKTFHTFTQEIGKIVFSSIKSTTSHGLPKILDANDFLLRLLWIVCFLASSAYCIYCVVDIIGEYLSYPVVSNVELIDELPTTFPTIMYFIWIF